ncbi:MAG: hypothetical protein ACTSWQ_09725, partial [Candidatus Thorarchaeota archaeon]
MAVTIYNGNNKEKIVDKVNLNNFGILFHDINTIEEFQKKSGMAGSYSVEYQHHFINVIGRIEADGQRLDIAIPMVMFNYHQEVAGASVEFNLGEVGTANNEAMPLAIEKFKEFEETDMFKALCDMGITKWEFHGMNSIHAHPNGVNRFSGTDLRANIDHPGVNFPLSSGKDVPNFASIIQHKEGHAEIIHTEYRLFNGIEKGERLYQKGRTLTINRGVPTKPEVEYVPLGPGAIDTIFGTTRPQPPKPAKAKNRPSYVLKDGLTLKEGDEIGKDLMELWETCPFQIDTSLILKTNVLRGRGRLQNNSKSWGHGTWDGENFPGKSRSRKDLDKLNEGLFGLADDEDEPTFSEMRMYLLKNGFTTATLAGLNIDQMTRNYELIINKDKVEDDFAEPTFIHKVDYLVTKEWERPDLVQLTSADLDHLYWTEKMDDDQDMMAGITSDPEDPDDDEMR